MYRESRHNRTLVVVRLRRQAGLAAGARAAYVRDAAPSRAHAPIDTHRLRTHCMVAPQPGAATSGNAGA
jgi:hypothetical protein